MTLILLTGEKGCGKTTACGRLAGLAADQHLGLGGVIAPARYDDQGVKTGILMRDLASGAERLLGQVVPVDDATATVGRYAFDNSVTAWGLACILQALATRLDIVLIDEVGPLELVQGAGLAPALDQLGSTPARSVILIVRPSLVDALAQRLAALQPQIMRLDLANRDQMPQRLLATALA